MKSDRDTRVAYFAWETPKEWIEALEKADYSRLPSRAAKPKV